MSEFNKKIDIAKEKKSRLTNKGKKRRCSFCKKSIHYRILDYIIVLNKILWVCEECKSNKGW